jgi:hypothetical protein
MFLHSYASTLPIPSPIPGFSLIRTHSIFHIMAAQTATATMKAVVIHEAGGPHVLKIQQWPKPKPQVGQVLIRVKAFGLNRSELYTRQ